MSTPACVALRANDQRAPWTPGKTRKTTTKRKAQRPLPSRKPNDRKKDRFGREELPAGEAGSYANGRASRSEPGRIVCEVLSICLKLHVTFVMALSLLSLYCRHNCAATFNTTGKFEVKWKIAKINSEAGSEDDHAMA